MSNEGITNHLHAQSDNAGCVHNQAHASDTGHNKPIDLDSMPTQCNIADPLNTKNIAKDDTLPVHEEQDMAKDNISDNSETQTPKPNDIGVAVSEVSMA